MLYKMSLIDSFLTTINVKRVISHLFVILVILLLGIYLISSSQTRDDYLIYTYFADVAAHGYNPYAVPDTFRSEVIKPYRYSVQKSPGYVPQYYADYPALQMMVNYIIYTLLGFWGLGYVYILLFLIGLWLYTRYVSMKNGHSPDLRKVPVLFIAFMVYPPVFLHHWFDTYTDKVIFMVFILLLLVFRKQPLVFTLIVALFTAMKGAGLPIFVLFMVNLWIKEKNFKKVLFLTTIFIILATLSHLPWYPHNLQAYKWRALRQTWVGHASIFLILHKLGYYPKIAPLLCMALGYLFLLILIMRKSLHTNHMILLGVVFSLMFGTEADINRILVVVFALLLFVDNYWLWLLNFIIGYFVGDTTQLVHSDEFGKQILGWSIIWGWVGLLLINAVVHVFRDIGSKHNWVEKV
ncbi:hypothetical protein ACFL27_03510 [candidate division CSSED10-310 bacterium]|uniref:DUF2029 domain-containing protein n=1 Tax=candidate division CSSED10-310 bacterium TaxID=2855610 RepID=A0ABV6YT32_UNCC1